MIDSWEKYAGAKTKLAESLRHISGAVALGKTTSNLFRERQSAPAQRLDVRDFRGVIAIDPQAMTADVAGMTTYAEVVEATLAQGFLPTVVPQLKSITVGGAIAGLGIEASSFRYGLVHETVLEFEVLLADGSTVIAQPNNEHSELFYGFPNSFGTLGYVLRAKIQLIPAKPYIKLRHIAVDSPAKLFDLVGQITSTGNYDGTRVDFIDGVVFELGHQYLTVANFISAAPYTSDYTYLKLYYRSIRTRTEDFLTAKDYIWRWDADWFWCSKNFPGAQNRLMRLIFGKLYLKSTFYWKLMAHDRRYHLNDHLSRLLGRTPEPVEGVIQDVEIPLPNCAQFLDFFQAQIGIKPIWLCPLRTPDPKATYPLYRLDPNQTYVNFGFWDTIPTHHPKGYFNRLIEAKVEQLGGHKSLYSDSFYTPKKFWQLYNQPAYNHLKHRYDPHHRLKDLYAKCVKNQ